MSELRQAIPDLATPINIGLLLWMAIGRGLFVPLGWMTVFVVLVSPLLVICLVITTRQMHRLPDRELTSGAARAHVVLWSAMFLFGLTCVDGGDSGPTYSVLMKVLGRAPGAETANSVLWTCSIIAGPVAWFVLQSRLSRSLATTPPPHAPGYPGPGPVIDQNRPD
ncbi:hypothetical protein ACT17_31550 [Mycolicibacterium conceptionense]|uniref:Integral membrane protein n=3 Tax=Mycolicibacterium TaxID=1866885 RepID=A0ABR5G1D4_9MYCO|nr:MULTISPECIES: hypothetical protein [Mycolicibacterium]KLI04363.1 hypothetical protein AA982_30350 [Mycolicibacterium senegalense]KLO54006.1 hypothetical protein ABW05_23565 [Mycolicibacterium senegalense]KMV14179.1 hypothetical protein ACT17_31550 [Mycolicibacterium conceptionense]QZH67734.1 hypothetical protein K6L26_08930 [Mycolicibacterium farcinogenes]